MLAPGVGVTLASRFAAICRLRSRPLEINSRGIALSSRPGPADGI
jgi:hypothetical protein